MKKQILLLISALAFSFSANAIVELRAGYGVNTPADDSINASTLTTVTGFNLDAIVELPMLPFGFGLRYEDMGFDVENTGVGDGTFESEFNRMSLIVNYRIIDLFAYFGLIGTLGFQNEAKLKESGIVDIEYDADLTFSAGVEGGLTFGLIMVGAELGYNIGTYENTNGTNPDVDFGGVYGKVLVGVSL